MNQSKIIFLLAAFFIVCLAGVSFAQNSPKPAEPSFDVILQTVVASNNSAEKSVVPPSLSSIVKNLKGDFSFSNYRLTSTFMQRISNNGNLELKSVAYEANPNKNLPVFSEWSLNGLQNLSDADGRETIQIQNFKFVQRVPVINNGGAVTYEPIGLSNKFSLPKNIPTVIGSLATTNPDELMFLILTVKTADK